MCLFGCAYAAKAICHALDSRIWANGRLYAQVGKRGGATCGWIGEGGGRKGGWTYKRVELLKSMWRDGQSASTIAAALGNTSRNAVIGKAQRLGLPKSNTAAAMERLQPILAPVALRNLQMERDRARRSLSSLEMRGRKFFEGSKKFKRNRERRAELENTIAALDRKIELAEKRLEGNA